MYNIDLKQYHKINEPHTALVIPRTTFRNTYGNHILLQRMQKRINTSGTVTYTIHNEAKYRRTRRNASADTRDLNMKWNQNMLRKSTGRQNVHACK